MLHGEAAAKEAHSAAQKAFTGGGVSANLPTFDIAKSEYPDGATTITLLKAAELVQSNGEARRKINEGAVRVNDERIQVDTTHSWESVLEDVSAFKVQVGKKRIASNRLSQRQAWAR